MDENKLRKNYILKNGDQIGIAIKPSGSSARKKVDHERACSLGKPNPHGFPTNERLAGSRAHQLVGLLKKGNKKIK